MIRKDLTLDILVGPIASGKSNFSKKRAKEGAFIVNDDAIVLALHGGDYSLYQPCYIQVYKAIETHILSTLMVEGVDVVIDRPCHRQDTRVRYIQLAKTFGYRTRLLLFPRESPQTHALRRSLDDSRGVKYPKWLKIANKHQSLYEPPNQELEKFDELVAVTTDTFDLS